MDFAYHTAGLVVGGSDCSPARRIDQHFARRGPYPGDYLVGATSEAVTGISESNSTFLVPAALARGID